MTTERIHVRCWCSGSLPKFWLAAFLGFNFLSFFSVCRAATITYLGADFLPKANWRTTTVDKPVAFDPTADDVYGSDGYYTVANSANGGNLPIVLSIPVHIIQTSANLSDGSPIWITSRSMPPFLFNDTKSANFDQRYYSVLLGP